MAVHGQGLHSTVHNQAPMEATAHGEQGPTWQQAVQWVEETPVARGDRLTVTAAHDTYGLSFRIQNAATCDQSVGEELAPLQVCGPADQVSAGGCFSCQERPQCKCGHRTPYGRQLWRMQMQPMQRSRARSHKARWSSGRSRAQRCAWPRGRMTQGWTPHRLWLLPRACSVD